MLTWNWHDLPGKPTANSHAVTILMPEVMIKCPLPAVGVQSNNGGGGVVWHPRAQHWISCLDRYSLVCLDIVHHILSFQASIQLTRHQLFSDIGWNLRGKWSGIPAMQALRPVMAIWLLGNFEVMSPLECELFTFGSKWTHPFCSVSSGVFIQQNMVLLLWG